VKPLGIDSEQSTNVHYRIGTWGFGPARWAARLSPAARLPESNPTKQQLARQKRYQPFTSKIPPDGAALHLNDDAASALMERVREQVRTAPCR
jgi:hypothetical protein